MIKLPAFRGECNCHEILRSYQCPYVDLGHMVLSLSKLVYLVGETRTGKTLTSLSIAQLYLAGHVLFVTKKKVIGSVKRDFLLLKPNFDILIINYESLHKLSKDDFFDLVIIDEAHTLGAFPKPSKRTKQLKAICRNKPIIYLSATPTPESFSSLYHELWISSYSPWAQYETFYKWAREYVHVTKRFVSTHLFTDYSDANADRVLDDTKYLRIPLTQAQAGFKYEIEEQVITCKVPQKIKDLTETLKRNLFIEIDNQDIIADTPAKKMSKVHQLSGGSIITDKRDYLVLSDYKAKNLKAYLHVNKINKPVVFYKYKSELKILESTFYPNVTDNPEVFQSFNRCMFAAQYLSGREGIRLDTADGVFFFSPDFAYLSYEQAKNRMQDLTREKTPKLYWLIGMGIDRDIMNAVRAKKDYTLAHFKERFLK